MAVDEDDIPFLEDDDLDRISRMLAAFESGRLDSSVPAPSKQRPLPPIETRIGQASSDIPALSYVGGLPVPGTGTTTPYYLDQTATPNSLIPTGEVDYTVYNFFDQKVYNGDWVGMILDPISGRYFVVLSGVATSSTSFGGSGSGSGVRVVTHVDCGSGGLHVVDGSLTGYVTIGGHQYPVTFNVGA